MMEENGVDDIGQLGGNEGTIQLALNALKEKKGNVDQVSLATPAVIEPYLLASAAAWGLQRGEI